MNQVSWSCGICGRGQQSCGGRVQNLSSQFHGTTKASSSCVPTQMDLSPRGVSDKLLSLLMYLFLMVILTVVITIPYYVCTGLFIKQFRDLKKFTLHVIWLNFIFEYSIWKTLLDWFLQLVHATVILSSVPCSNLTIYVVNDFSV